MTTPTVNAVDMDALQASAKLHRPLARAASLARSNALGYVVFGALSLVVSAAGADVPGLALGCVLAVVGVLQLKAAPKLRHADPSAPRTLARNELVLLASISVYCLLKLTLLRESGAELEAQIGDTSDLGFDVGDLTNSLNTAVYSTMLAISILYQGGMARYYLRRRPMVQRYLAEVPRDARALVESLQS